MDKLNADQQKAFKAIKEGKNVCITGRAGSGKTHILQYVRNYKGSFKKGKNIAFTSTTGYSATHINGTTIHSFAGIGTGTQSVDALYDKINKSKFYRERWNKTCILVIDEMSMLTVELFEKLDDLAKRVRKSKEPFGGLQIVLLGDWLQLPPVKSERFLFESKRWNEVIHETIILRENFRQKDDHFDEILTFIRMGHVDKSIVETLKSREIPYPTDTTDIIPTMLVGINARVDEINESFYDKIDEPEHKYNMIVDKTNKSYNEKLVRFVPELKLKKYAQVMHLTNQNGLVNGSRGVVVDFDEDGFPIVKFNNGQISTISRQTLDVEYDGEVLFSYTQIPLRLAWALTFHKAQGVTLDTAVIDFKHMFGYGAAYVALSRLKSLDGLYIQNFRKSAIKAHPSAVEFYSP